MQNCSCCTLCTQCKKLRPFPPTKFLQLPIARWTCPHIDLDFITNLLESQENTMIMVIIYTFSKSLHQPLLFPWKSNPSHWPSTVGFRGASRSGNAHMSIRSSHQVTEYHTPTVTCAWWRVVEIGSLLLPALPRSMTYKHCCLTPWPTTPGLFPDSNWSVPPPDMHYPLLW